MDQLVFFEKPGCIGNAQQKVRLREFGVEFEVRDLLTEPWSTDTLRPFFGSTSTAEWFNASAPAVKSGRVNTMTCSEAEALAMMLEDPLLIRRPLLELGEMRQAGFVDGPVLEVLGVDLRSGEDLQDCPLDDARPRCEERT